MEHGMWHVADGRWQMAEEQWPVAGEAGEACLGRTKFIRQRGKERGQAAGEVEERHTWLGCWAAGRQNPAAGK